MNEEELQQFKELFSKYCRQEINKLRLENHRNSSHNYLNNSNAGAE